MRRILFFILCVASFLLLLMFTVRVSWERGVFDNRSLWFVLVMSVGNTVESLCVLLQFLKLPHASSPSDILIMTIKPVSEAAAHD